MLVSEVKMSLYSSINLSTCLYCVEELAKALAVAVIFYAPSDQNMKRQNLPFLELIFLHCLVVIKETAGTTFGLFYS